MEASNQQIIQIYRKPISFGLFILAGLCIFLPFINEAEMTGMNIYFDKSTSFSLFEIVKGDVFVSTGLARLWSIFYLLAINFRIIFSFSESRKRKRFCFLSRICWGAFLNNARFVFYFRRNYQIQY